MTTFTKLEVVEMLREYDHAFISAERVKELTEPFGFIGSTFLARNTLGPDNPKGLLLNDNLTEMEGQDAAVVAEEIAAQVCGFKPWQLGRGSRLRSACDAIEQHLTKETIAQHLTKEK